MSAFQSFSPHPNKRIFWKNFATILGTKPEDISHDLQMILYGDNRGFIRESAKYFEEALINCTSKDADKEFSVESLFQSLPEHGLYPIGRDDDLPNVGDEYTFDAEFIEALHTALGWKIPRSLPALSLRIFGTDAAIVDKAYAYFGRSFLTQLEIGMQEDMDRKAALYEALPNHGLYLIKRFAVAEQS